nr:MAG TPA: hypothetical protein [Caudoviricetes sp.]
MLVFCWYASILCCLITFVNIFFVIYQLFCCLPTFLIDIVFSMRYHNCNERS